MTTTSYMTAKDYTPPTYDPKEELRILTLWQPYASLMAWGEKQVETRPNKWKYRGWIAIHSAVKPPQVDMRNPHFCDALQAHGVMSPAAQLPFGKIIGICRIHTAIPCGAQNITAKEQAFGNYADGRWAYLTDGVRSLGEHGIPYRGAQGLIIAPAWLRQMIASRIEREARK